MPLQPQAVLEKSEVKKCNADKKCNVALFNFSICVTIFNRTEDIQNIIIFDFEKVFLNAFQSESLS